jgi:hypothetical protein
MHRLSEADDANRHIEEKAAALSSARAQMHTASANLAQQQDFIAKLTAQMNSITKGTHVRDLSIAVCPLHF